MSAAVLNAVRSRQQTLQSVVDRWLADIAEDTTSRGPLTLPLQDSSGSEISLEGVVRAFPRVLVDAEGLGESAAIQARLLGISGELTASNGELRNSASTLATEVGLSRTLLVPGDVFDVSAFGIAMLTAAANLLHMAYGRKVRAKRNENPEPEVRSVQAALDFAAAKGAERPGDLWLADLAARTALAVADDLKKGGRGTPERIVNLMPRFVALSLLVKLTALERIGPAIAKKSDYKLWPGLGVFLCDPGARPLRAVLVGELAAALCSPAAGMTQIALFRFLAALTAIDDPPSRIAAHNLAATLFWEILELDPKAMSRMVDLGPPAASLLDMLEKTDAAARAVAPTELAADHERLAETCACLRTFPEYTALLALRRGLVNRSIV